MTVVQPWVGGIQATPTEQVAAATGASKPRRSRIVLLAVLGTVLLAWGITATVIAVQQRDGWTETKRELAATRSDLTSTRSELESTEADLVAMTDERDALAADLEALESEKAALDARLEEVAGEKALAEDEREALRQVLAIAPDVTAWMRDCADANEGVTQAVLDFVAVMPYGSITFVEIAVDNAESVCAQARTLASELETVVDGLTG